MAIHGRFWADDFPNLLTVERMAEIGDVKRLEGRKPDAIDRKAVRLGSYVVVKALDGTRSGQEELYHIANLRADGGWTEIQIAIDAVKAKEGK